MNPFNDFIHTTDNHEIQCMQLIGVGRQGAVYRARDRTAGKPCAVKLFSTPTPDLRTRLVFLHSQNLSGACSALAAPQRLIMLSDAVGHCAPFIPGRMMEEYFQPGPTAPAIWHLQQGVQMAAAIAHALSVMHQRGMANGDIRAPNLIVQVTATVVRISFIDLDNFQAPGCPATSLAGGDGYLAPELLRALAGGPLVRPSIQTDLYALAALMSEVLLLRPLTEGHNSSEAEHNRAVLSGIWLHDPLRAGDGLPPAGLPASILDSDLQRLFRKAVSLAPGERPTAQMWRDALMAALERVATCPQCNKMCVIDRSRTHCPHCRAVPPHLMVVVAGRPVVRIASGAVPLGRKYLAASQHVSENHAVLRRVGPETWIESYGRNGTFRWNGHTWARLPDAKPILLSAGDRLRFADVEGVLKVA